jgi:antitoxin component YwqK of YwqJK toxin-antitoxin module
MKKKLFIFLSLLLVVGCSKPINDETLIDKDGLKYHPDTKEFYSGETTKYRLGGAKEFDGIYKYGKPDGRWIFWYPFGRKSVEQNYKNGKKDGLWIYYDANGEKKEEGNFENGKEVGKWTFYNDDGLVKEVKEY